MSETPQALEALRQWVEKAEHDLLNIENNLTATDIPWDTVCFHAQPCVEKYLKALLVWKNLEFPKTHDLRMLLQCLPNDIAFELPHGKIFLLNRYSIEGRYPGDWEPITSQEAEEAVAIARQIRQEARSYLPLAKN